MLNDFYIKALYNTEYNK